MLLARKTAALAYSQSNYQSELSAKFDAGFILAAMVRCSTIRGITWYLCNDCATEMGTCMAFLCSFSSIRRRGRRVDEAPGSEHPIGSVTCLFVVICLATNYQNEIGLG